VTPRRDWIITTGWRRFNGNRAGLNPQAQGTSLWSSTANRAFRSRPARPLVERDQRRRCRQHHPAVVDAVAVADGSTPNYIASVVNRGLSISSSLVPMKTWHPATARLG
jgi:hypothetical protein